MKWESHPSTDPTSVQTSPFLTRFILIAPTVSACFYISPTIVYFYTTHRHGFKKTHQIIPFLNSNPLVYVHFIEKKFQSLLRPTKPFMTCLLTVLELHHSMQFHKHAKQAPPLNCSFLRYCSVSPFHLICVCNWSVTTSERHFLTS